MFIAQTNLKNYQGSSTIETLKFLFAKGINCLNNFSYIKPTTDSLSAAFESI